MCWQTIMPMISRHRRRHTRRTCELRAFAGEYRSSDLDVTYRVVVRDSSLVVQIPGRADAVLDAIVPDTFTGGTFDTLRFLRDADGSVIAAALHSSGIRALRFDRIPKAVRVIREGRGRPVERDKSR